MTSSAMYQRILLLFIFVVIVSSFFTPVSVQQISIAQNMTVTETVTSTNTVTPTQIVHLCINEIAPHPETTATPEYIELFNAGEQIVSTAGIIIDDDPLGGSPPYALPDVTIVAGGYYVVNNGVSLNNTGDTVVLYTNDDMELDRYVYGNTTVGQVFGRFPDGEIWYERFVSSPGQPNTAPPVTETPLATETMEVSSTSTPGIFKTTTMSPTTTPFLQPTLFIKLSEVLPAPSDEMDWDADGVANGDDEWIELCNTTPSTQSLAGLLLDDSEGGSEPYALPTSTMLAPFACAVFYRKDTKIVLNNTNDGVRILSAHDKSILDSMTYANSKSDVSWQLQGDVWVLEENSSLGKINSVSTATPSSSIPAGVPALPPTGVALFSLF